MAANKQIVLRHYPSIAPITSPKEVSPTVVIARTTPQPVPNPVTVVSTQPRVMVASSPHKIIRIEEKSEDVHSIDYDYRGGRNYRKLLSGFHPYYDKETDILALQCCTCCIGCWRKCSTRCTGCENFISCPIYCWLLFILPLFLLLVTALVVLSVYAAHWF